MVENCISSDEKPVGIAGASRRMLKRAIAIAAHDNSVLITGECGSGRKTLARFIHSMSARGAGPLTCLHGIDATREGLDQALDRTERATVLLESLSEFSAELQARVVRYLQRPASQRAVRVIATDTADLSESIRNGSLRNDLYFLVTEMTVQVPPLRQRVEDILPLAARYLSSPDRPGCGEALSSGAVDVLRQHSWPGNILELFNTLRRAALISPSAVIEAEAIELDPITAMHGTSALGLAGRSDNEDERMTIDGRSAFARQRDQAERSILLAALREGRSSQIDVAQRLGISPRTLRYKLARLRSVGMEIPA
jgi:two-component system response regulator FlrC